MAQEAENSKNQPQEAEKMQKKGPKRPQVGPKTAPRGPKTARKPIFAKTPCFLRFFWPSLRGHPAPGRSGMVRDGPGRAGTVGPGGMRGAGLRGFWREFERI